MKHNYLLRGCSALISGVALLCGSLSAAAVEPDELPQLNGAVLELEHTYYCSADYKFKDVTATFTPAYDMRLAMEYTGYGSSTGAYSILVPFFDANYEQEDNSFHLKPGYSVKYLDVQKDRTIYFKVWADQVPFTLKVYDADNKVPLIRDYNPEPGTKISASYNKYVDVMFDDQVTIGAVEIISGDKRVSADPVMLDGNTTARVVLQDIMMTWYNNGTLKADDALKVRMTDVVSASNPSIKVNGDGIVEIDLTVYGKPVSMVGQHNTPGYGNSDFLSYYLPDDERGVITLTFDGPIMPYEKLMQYYGEGEGEFKSIITPFMLSMGSGEQMDVYYETLIPVIDPDNYTVTLDVRDKLRTYATMGLNLEWEEMYLLLTTVRSADGQFINTYGSGSIGSVGFSYKYVPVVNSDLASEFLVFNGADSDVEVSDHTLADGYRMEVYVDGYKNIRLSGFAFEYADGQERVVVPMSDITLREEPGYDNAINYVFMVPELPGIGFEDQVTVYPADLLSNDGMDHVTDLKDTFTWNVQTGINGVTAGETFTVYGVDGTVALRGASERDLKGLAKGLYIANGKKVLVK